MKRSLFIIALSTFLLSCSSFEIEENVVDKYYITALDFKINATLSYEVSEGGYIGITPNYTYAYAYNKKYIVVKQHPVSGDEIQHYITNYYIILRQSKDYQVPNQIYEGPISETKFINLVNEINKYGQLNFKEI